MVKVISGIEISSILPIKQRRVKKSHKNCPELSVESIKHKCESVVGVKSVLLHGYFFMFSHQKCGTTFFRERMRMTVSDCKNILKKYCKIS